MLYFVFDATKTIGDECAVKSERFAHFIAWALTLLTGRCHDYHGSVLVGSQDVTDGGYLLLDEEGAQ